MPWRYWSTWKNKTRVLCGSPKSRRLKCAGGSKRKVQKQSLWLNSTNTSVVVNRLETDGLAHMGHAGTVAGTLELVIYPYIIVYKVREKRREILIVSIVHGARNR